MRIPPFKHCPGFSALPLLFSVCFLIVTSFATLPPIQAVRWETDLSVATARAEREQRPLFLHFVGSESTNAQKTGSEVFMQPNIAAHLNANFVMVRINAVDNPVLAQRFSVTAIPTDLIVRPNGQQIHRRVGVISTERFAEYLAFLQTTIQADKNQVSATSSHPSPQATGSLSTANPPSGIQPIPSPSSPFPSAVSSSAPPAATVLPNAPNNNVVALGAFRDPFTQQPATVQSPPNVLQSPMEGAAAHPLPTDNPLRAEVATRPVEQSTASIPLAPDATQSIQEEFAPAKMMIEVPLALEGSCPIMLCTEERWVSGNPAYSTMYQGHVFRFSSLEALVTFSRNPASYTPVAMGEDIVLRVDRNRRVNGDRRFGAWYQGRVFLFSSQETYNAFEARPDYYSEIAIKYEVARREQPVTIVY